MNEPFVRLFPETASTLAPRVDALFFFLLAMTGTVTVAIAVLIVVFAARYRRRPGAPAPRQIAGSHRIEIAWTLVPLALFMVPFAWGMSLYVETQAPPANALEVYVVARQWMWKFQHPGGQREIDSLHVPAGRPVKLVMTSQDVIHSFYTPAFRVKQDVLPGRYTTVWFEATAAGRYHLFCAEYCGTAHSRMRGFVTVLEPRAFEEWLALGGSLSLASEGQKLFHQLGCGVCHRADSLQRAPILAGLYRGPVQLTTGEVVRADDEYLRESILEPAAKVVLGFQPIMPTFQGRVDEEDLLRLLAYIKSLGPRGDELPGGATPPPEPPLLPVPGEAGR